MKITVNKSYELDVPDYGTWLDQRQLKELVSRSGSHFFDADTMRGFKSRLHDIRPRPDGWYFITSEKHEWHTSYGSGSKPRMYTIRRLRPRTDGSDLAIDTVYDFQAFPTLQRARTVLKRLAKEGALICDHCTGTPHHEEWCQTLRKEAE